MIVTVGGLVGSGKTVVSKKLSVKYNLKYISAGSVMRKMAAEQHLSLPEFSKLAEKNPAIDREIDERQVEEAVGDCIVDSRLGAFFLKPDLSIWLTASIGERARRVRGRENSDKKILEIIEEIKKREASERKRYKKYYKINLDDLSVYGLVIDTRRWNVDGVVRIASTAIDSLQ